MSEVNQSPGPDEVATADVRVEHGTLRIVVGGVWRQRGALPGLDLLRRSLASAGAVSSRVAIVPEGLTSWDSSLAVYVIAVRELVAPQGGAVDLGAMPIALRQLVEEVVISAGPKTPYKLLTTRLGEQTHRLLDAGHEHFHFFGECIQALVRVVLQPHRFRWGDALEQMRRCGAAALPIVGLISALVGVIMAFVAALQLRQFGADIFVADLVGLAVFREMGPMMAAIVLTGRTGAAFAAELGNMVLGEEVDALKTFGVRPVDFLVAPRMLALLLMMPLLAIYADFLGIVGGMLVAQAVLDIVPAAFFAEMQTAVALTDIGTGLIKSLAFGWIVAYSGCFRGMRAGRSSVEVGEATTGAVVMGILLIIVADAAFAVVFSFLGW